MEASLRIGICLAALSLTALGCARAFDGPTAQRAPDAGAETAPDAGAETDAADPPGAGAGRFALLLAPYDDQSRPVFEDPTYDGLRRVFDVELEKLRTADLTTFSSNLGRDQALAWGCEAAASAARLTRQARYLDVLERVADYYIDHPLSDGGWGIRSGYTFFSGTPFSYRSAPNTSIATASVYGAWCLLNAYEVTGRPRYLARARRALDLTLEYTYLFKLSDLDEQGRINGYTWCSQCRYLWYTFERKALWKYVVNPLISALRAFWLAYLLTDEPRYRDATHEMIRAVATELITHENWDYFGILAERSLGQNKRDTHLVTEVVHLWHLLRMNYRGPITREALERAADRMAAAYAATWSTEQIVGEPQNKEAYAIMLSCARGDLASCRTGMRDGPSFFASRLSPVSAWPRPTRAP